MGYCPLFYGPAHQKGTPRWRGPARIHIDDTGTGFQSQTLEVARYCAREKVEAQDMRELGRSPATVPTNPWNGVSTEDIEGGRKQGRRTKWGAAWGAKWRAKWDIWSLDMGSGEPGAPNAILR